MQPSMNIKNLVKKEVAGLKAYSAREIPCRVKLDANESPYGLGDALKAIEVIDTNRYPDPEAKKVRKIMARDLRVKPGNILQGNGSDELIYYLIATFGGPVLYPVPTFSMYGIIAQALGEKGIGIPLDKNFDLDTAGMLSAIKRERPKLVFLSSPNNPTGNCFSADRMLKIIGAAKGIAVVDEAYQPFAGGQGFLTFLRDYENLAILRTLSKIGLAALRMGFLIADETIIEEVNKVRLPFNVNSLSQAVAVEALKEKKQLSSFVRSITAERDRVSRELEKLEGVVPFPSEANFILFRVKDPDAVYESLLKKGILVRNISGTVGGCLRVTVGRPEENRAFLEALRKILISGQGE